MSEFQLEMVDDAAAAVSKREHILDRLNKRNKDRQNFLDVKLEQRNKENVVIEGADYFAQTFSERARDIESRIQNMSDIAAKKTSVVGDAPNPDLGHLFTAITADIQELQRYLTTSTMFLSDYKIKACQTLLNELTNSCDETRTRLMPKKKFGFSGKKIAPKIVINPKINTAVSAIADNIDAPAAKFKALHQSDNIGSNNTTTTTAPNPNKTFIWTLFNREQEYICLQDEDVNGQDITISNLKNCFVELRGHAGSVQILDVKNCTFLCGPIARSFFAENCRESVFAVACQQLRLHSSIGCRIHLHVTCRAIIEDSKNIEITTYDYEYPEIEGDFLKAGLDIKQNNYTDIADFNWLSPDIPSPNWSLLNADCAPPNWNELREQFVNKLSQTEKHPL